MSDPTRTHTTANACTVEHQQLARDFVAFVKSAFVYPDNHSRVVEARAALLQRAEAWVRTSGKPFVLELRAEGLCAPSGKVADIPLLPWFQEQLQKALLGTIALDERVTPDGLQDFATQLRAVCSGKVDRTATFASLWDGWRQPGVQLAELRFFGGFHDLDFGEARGDRTLRATIATPAAELQATLSRLGMSEELVARIQGLEQRLSAAAPWSDGSAPLSLPRELLAALPADVVTDPAARPQFIAKVLDEFERLLETEANGDVDHDQVDLVKMFRGVARSFFGVDPQAVDERHEGPLPTAPSRPEDQACDLEDPERLLPLVEALPERQLQLEPVAGVLQAEVLEICLRQLGQHSEDRVVEPTVAKVRQILDDCQPQSVLLLEQYVKKELDPAANLLPPAAVRSALQALGDHDLLPAVRRRGALDLEQVARYFPGGFVMFVDSLSLGVVGDADALAKALAGIDEGQLAAGCSQLVQHGAILEPARVHKLMQLGGRQALGLARHLLQSQQPVVQQEVFLLLQRLHSRRPEAVPLQYIEVDRLPPWYLQLLCDLERTGKHDPRLRDHAGLLLRSYVETLVGDPQRLLAKLPVITALGAFPGRATAVVLRQVLRGRGLFGFLRVPRQVRQVAQSVLLRCRETNHV